MALQARSWRRRGRACEQIVELAAGGIYVCGKYTTDRSARCGEHREKQPAARRWGPRDQRQAS